jgi:hypothetical protein
MFSSAARHGILSGGGFSARSIDVEVDARFHSTADP